MHVAPAATPERVAAVIKSNTKDSLKHPVVSHGARGRHFVLVQGSSPSDWGNSRAKPTEGWIWTALTKSGHVESSSLKKQHARTFELLVANAAETKENPVRPFVLYSLRHTFLTRLGESGCDAFTLARIAGHSSVSMSSRYDHPSEDAILTAMANLGSHNNGHCADQQQLPPIPQGQVAQ